MLRNEFLQQKKIPNKKTRFSCVLGCTFLFQMLCTIAAAFPIRFGAKKNNSELRKVAIVGSVTDSIRKTPISEAKVFEVVSGKIFTTDQNGLFSAVVVSGEECRLVVFHDDYIKSDTITIGLGNKSTVIRVGLQPLIMPQDTIGVLRGVVRNLSTSLPVSGARVFILQSKQDVITDSIGTFFLPQVPQGPISILILAQDYKEIWFDTLISPNCTTNVSIVLAEDFSDSVKLPEVLVEQDIDSVVPQKNMGHSVTDSTYYEVIQKATVIAKMRKNTASTMLVSRQESFSIMDGVARDEMTAAGTKSAAEALKLVTGITIVGGRYIIVRGLSERYSNILLNGIELPSADPDRRAVPLDLFPAGLIDNIDAVKTTSADIASNFSGGSININTRTFPEKFETTLSTKMGINDQTTFRNDFLTEKGGKYDWLGIDDGTRAMPGSLGGLRPWVPLETDKFGKSDSQKTLIVNRVNEVAKSFKTKFQPISVLAWPNIGFSLSAGNTINIFERPLGLYAGLTYDQTLKTEKGLRATWTVGLDDFSTADSMTPLRIFDDHKSTRDVLWGGLAAVGVNPLEGQELKATLLYTRSSDAKARYMLSRMYVGFEENENFEKREIHFRQRGIFFGSISGSHSVNFFLDPLLTWSMARVFTSQEEPDRRIFVNIRTVTQSMTIMTDSGIKVLPADTFYAIAVNKSTLPRHSFRLSLEDGINYNVDLLLKVPQLPWTHDTLKVKTGVALQEKKRSYVQHEFEVRYGKPSKTLNECKGDIDRYAGHENMGMVELAPPSDPIGNTIIKRVDTSANHDGHQTILSGYGLCDIPLTAGIRLAVGARHEKLNMTIESWVKGDSLYNGFLNERRIFPSVSLVWQLFEKVYLRSAYGQSTARPLFREKAPYGSYDVGMEEELTGNARLRSSLINNYDIRLEWYPGPGELIAASVFYKLITDPITIKYSPYSSDIIQFTNVSDAHVRGMELEIRKRLGWVHHVMQPFSVGANFSYTYSMIRMDEDKKARLDLAGVKHTGYLPLYGASPFVINIMIRYEPEDKITTGALSFNLFGKRPDYYTPDENPDVYELSQPELNISVSRYLFNKVKLNVGGKNLLNPEVKKAQFFKNEPYFRESFFKGRTYSCGLTYSF